MILFKKVLSLVYSLIGNVSISLDILCKTAFAKRWKTISYQDEA